MSKEEIRQLLYNKIIRFISHNQRTEFEVRSKLEKICSNMGLNCEINPDMLEELMNELRQEGYVNDASYCENLILQQQQKSNPKSIMEIKKFLYKKGVNSNLSQTIIDELYTIDFELSILSKLISKKRNQYDLKSLKKYLLNKGFRYDVVESSLTA